MSINESDENRSHSRDDSSSFNQHNNGGSTIIMRLNNNKSNSIDNSQDYYNKNQNSSFNKEPGGNSIADAIQKSSSSSELSVLKHKLKEMRDKHLLNNSHSMQENMMVGGN